MCAAVASRRGLRILVIDQATEAGQKILISGGGRCNFTNLDTAADRFISNNPHFVKSALGRYTPQDFIAMVERHKIAWHEKEPGQLFCDGSASQIVAMLLEECASGNVKFEYGRAIERVEHRDGEFHVWFGDGMAAAPSLVIATGGPSIPKIGATGFAYDLARQFGLKVIQPHPALVPLKLGEDELLFRKLSGVSCNVSVRCGKTEFQGAALFTHRGLSGPAILQISSYWRRGDQISINFHPGLHAGWLTERKKKQPRSTLRKALAIRLPDRLAKALALKFGVESDIGNIPDKRIEEIEQRLSDWHFTPTGSEGFAKAEVTVGGVDTVVLSSKTMQAKRVPGLYFIGEAVDVTGWLGGYNFQWAWASGHAAGDAL